MRTLTTTLLAGITLGALLAHAAPPPLNSARRSDERHRTGERQVPAPQHQTPATTAPHPPGDSGGETLLLQVTLDRAGFSPGVIDGRMGTNTKKALALYQEHRGTEDLQTVPALTTYAITPDDEAGPFLPQIPRDLQQQANLPTLAYTSVLEALAERFHSTPALLRQLNPTAQFTTGEQIQVPNVEPLVIPIEKPEASADARAAAREAQKETAQRPDVIVTISKSRSALTTQDSSGRIILYAPVTTGSEHDPLPIGAWKVTGIQLKPIFNYNPDLFWDADPTHSKARIPPGPNNPVGLVWIDLSKEHYGIHGTPEPSSIGRTESHGCVRLTNWDALKLAGLVKPGTKVIFTE